MKAGLVFYVWLGVLVILAGLGVYAWNIQYTEGLSVTGLSDIAIWGIYITDFEFLVGVSAGIITTISIGYLFDPEKFKPVMKVGSILAIANVLPAMLFVVADLGRPERILNIVSYANPSSMFVADFWSLSAYLVFSILFFLAFITERRGGAVGRFFAALAIPIAIIVHSITAWAFSVLIARPLWHTALLAPIFLSSALVSGVGLLILATILTSRLKEITIPSELFSILGRALAAVIPVDFFFILAELVTAGYSSTGSLLTVLSTALTGAYAPVIAIEIALVAIVFLPLVHPKTRKSIAILGILAIFAMAGIWVKRFFLLIPALSLSPLGETDTYAPTLVEWQITVGLFAFGAILYSLGLKVLPFLTRSDVRESGNTTTQSKSFDKARTDRLELRKKETDETGASRRGFLKSVAGASVGAAALATVPASPLLLSKKEPKEQTSPIKEWAMVVDLRRCIGCQACFAACKSENGVPLGIQYTWVETHEEGKYPNIKLTFLPRLCNHCDNPPCTPVCPVYATYKREDGIVVQDMNRCIGCRYCMAACPYEVRSFLWEEPSGAWPEAWKGKAEEKHGFVVKCHACYHRIEKGLKPACVDTCVGGARIFGDLQDPESEVRRIVDTIPTQTLKPYLGTKPMVFYVGLPEKVAERGKKDAATIIMHEE